MGSPEDEALEREKARALDVFRPTNGALITHQYLERKQEVVAVNRTDLEDILTFDGLGAGFSALGMFFLAGGGWLGIEKFIEQEKPVLTPLLAICLASAVVGVTFFGAGLILRHKKRGRIRRIFKETGAVKQ